MHAGYRASDAEDLWRVGVVTVMQIRLERGIEDERSSYEGEPGGAGGRLERERLVRRRTACRSANRNEGERIATL